MQRHALNLLFAAAVVAALVGAAAQDPAAEPAGAAVERAVYVGDETCLACHQEYALPPGQIHARIEPFEVGGRTVGCEGCHGPGSVHAEEMDPGAIRTFDVGGVGDEGCMSCHRSKGLAAWHASTHAVSGVGCSDCHGVHAPKVAQEACRSCHGEVVALFQLPSHHPLREGKMDCGSCHDPHNSREAMLRISVRPNDVCTTCHQAQEGPFIFEHPPVVEDCRTCHLPHGSVADNLLTANEPTLCLQCHDLHFHAGYRGSEAEEVEVGGIPRENPFGVRGFNIAFTTRCTQCHSRIHGSDLPSQTVTGQGEGLTQ